MPWPQPSGCLEMCVSSPTSPFILCDQNSPWLFSRVPETAEVAAGTAVRDRVHAAGCFLSAPSTLAAAILVPRATGVTHRLGRGWCQVLGRTHWPSGLLRVRRKSHQLTLTITELHVNCHSLISAAKGL